MKMNLNKKIVKNKYYILLYFFFNTCNQNERVFSLVNLNFIENNDEKAISRDNRMIFNGIIGFRSSMEVDGPNFDGELM